MVSKGYRGNSVTLSKKIDDIWLINSYDWKPVTKELKKQICQEN